MKYVKRCLAQLAAALMLFVVSLANAAPADLNAVESISVAMQGGILNVRLSFSKPLTVPPQGFSISNPARVALDFPNTTNALGRNSQVFNEGGLKSANIIQSEGRTRVVMNLMRPMGFESTIEGNTLLVALTPSTKEGAIPKAVEHFSTVQPSQQVVNIRDIVFRRGGDGEARILVDLTDPNAGIDIRPQGENLVVDFVKVNVPDVLRKKLDVTDFATPVVEVNTTQIGENTRMTIIPKGLWEHNAYQTDNQFVIEVKRVIENPNKLIQGSRGGYQGEKLSLNFQNVDVRRLLQVIGEFTGMNMVVSDSVSGAITLILKDVPWDQALDIILQQKGLDMRKNGNVILVAPREEIAAKEKLEFEAKAQIGDLEPLRTESFQLNYQKAEEIKKLLTDSSQRMLSKRGSAVFDARTNILFVQDTANRLDDVRQVIAKVDLAVRQVMIEARIVEAGDSFAKNLGVRLGWNQGTGGSGQVGSANAVYGGSLNNTAYQTGQTTTKATLADTLNVNLPATPRAGTAGAFSVVLYNNSGTRFLNAEISALEADGKAKVISSPRVMTANQVEAIIEQGTEIPYQQATSSGATSVSFRKANLSLKVKPQITPDGRVTMSLDINKDTANTTLSTGSGVAIDTKHVKTEVLVDNGGTVVIGGIYTQKTSESTNRIPFFGDLPYIGWLFKNREWIDDKTELLVFITPRILTDTLSLR